jgi:glycosyltransferase involved in cell wall biosynthesis
MNSKRQKKVFLSVTNDLVADARVHKVATSLHSKGCDVTLIGRKLKYSLMLRPRVYHTKRFRLFFEKGPLFYAEFNFRLFFFLLFQPVHLLVANDLDTLLPNFLVSKIKGVELYYDTHEYFTGVPELSHRKMVRAFWEKLESMLFPRLRHVYTVNESIALLYEKKYNVTVNVVRNLPHSMPVSFKGDKNENILLYQGAVNMDRGLEEMIEAMVYINNATLLVIGDGDVLDHLKKRADQLQLKGKVRFTGKMPFEALRPFTENATIGLCIEKDSNINYRFCLPNKLFDYIQAGIPVLATPLVEIKKIIENYKVGTYIESHDPVHLARKVNTLLENKMQLECWSKNAIKAACALNWQQEEQRLFDIYSL